MNWVFGELSFGELSVGELSLGELSFGDMSGHHATMWYFHSPAKSTHFVNTQGFPQTQANGLLHSGEEHSLLSRTPTADNYGM